MSAGGDFAVRQPKGQDGERGDPGGEGGAKHDNDEEDRHVDGAAPRVRRGAGHIS